MESKRKEKVRMSSREDQAQKETLLNGAEEDAASRIFAHEPGEGEA
jgi:hypothetical protein